MILVELRKMFRRPRTWATIAALNALPLVVAVLRRRAVGKCRKEPVQLRSADEHGSAVAVGKLAEVALPDQRSTPP